MSEQTTIDVRPPDVATARAVGQIAGELATARAERDVTDFRARAEAAILERLAAGPASAEDLTDHVKACGVPLARNGKELGSLYASLLHRKKIRRVEPCSRRNGHGTSGGWVYARCG